jgi:glyoxylase-like metal-dependent hydrolase (beta-lactamase superfamily II)
MRLRLLLALAASAFILRCCGGGAVVPPAAPRQAPDVAQTGPPDGTSLRELLPGVLLVEQRHAGITVRGAVVLGRERAAVFDTLMLPDGMRRVAAACGQREVVAVYSHADWDHVLGTAPLAPARVVAHERCAARFADRNDVAAQLDAHRDDAALAGVRLVPPTETFSKELTLDLGGLHLELSWLPGHTQDCIVGFVPELGVLLGGDTFETPVPVLGEDSSIGTWVDGLRRWEGDARVLHAVPSHGDLGDRALLRYDLSYLEAVHRGDAFRVPHALDAFYQEAHDTNVRLGPKLR